MLPDTGGLTCRTQMHSPLEAAVGTNGLSTLHHRRPPDTFSFPKTHPSPFHLLRRIRKEIERERNNRKRLRGKSLSDAIKRFFKEDFWWTGQKANGRWTLSYLAVNMDSVLFFKSTIILASVHFHCASTRVSPKEKRDTGTPKNQNEQNNYFIDKSRSQSWNELR